MTKPVSIKENRLQKVLLLLVAFLSGAILMGVELVGSRILQPAFGGAIFVWGSLIGVFMAALSIGYYIGGRLVDKHPRPAILALCLFLSGLFIALLPHFGKTVCDKIAIDYGLDRTPLGSLLASMVLFLVPGILMAVTSPFVIRLTASTVEQVGNTAGVVYAISTMGSIAGTFITSFYLISVLYTQDTLYLLGALLILTSILTLMVRLPRQTKITVFAGLLLLLLPAAKSSAAERILFEGDSQYQRLFVVQEGNYRILRTSGTLQTRMDIRDPQGRGYAYTDYVDIAFLINPKIKNVLVIGLGGGTVPKRLIREHPNVNVDVAEIDPLVIKLAKQYFNVNPGPRLKIHQSDGRIFLRRSNKKYDLIMLDAYYADSVPFFMATKEFFEIVNDHLTPNGIFYNNLIGAVSGPRSKFFRSVYRTMKGSFAELYVFPVNENSALVNIEVFGLKSKLPGGFATIKKRGYAADNGLKYKAVVKESLGNYLSSSVSAKDVPVLEDDYAPVDALIHLW